MFNGLRSQHGQRACLGYHDPSSGPLSGHNERDLFPNLAVFGSSVEFDHLPRLCLDLHTVGECILATTVARTVPVPCPEVPLAPGRSS
jgi:hypothetical protein